MSTDEERMQRESNLVAAIRNDLPEFAKACAGDAEVVLLHQDAFAADYQDDEYVRLGMAIKYAGYRGLYGTTQWESPWERSPRDCGEPGELPRLALMSWRKSKCKASDPSGKEPWPPHRSFQWTLQPNIGFEMIARHPGPRLPFEPRASLRFRTNQAIDIPS